MSKHLDGNKLEKLNALGRQLSDATIFLHENIARKAGLSVTDHKYLGLIMQKGAVTAGQLSGLTGLTTGAVTGLVDRLEKKELVQREYDEMDRRKVLIVPNYEKANKLLGPLLGELQKRVVQLISSYTDEETEIIEKYLRESIQMLNGFSDEIKSAK